MGGVFAALYPNRTRAAVLMNCTASVADEAQKKEFLQMSSVLREQHTVPKAVVDLAINAFAGATTERTRPEVAEFIRSTVAAARADSVCWANSIVSFRAAPSIVAFWAPFENQSWWWLVRRTEHFRSPKPTPWQRPFPAVSS